MLEICPLRVLEKSVHKDVLHFGPHFKAIWGIWGRYSQKVPRWQHSAMKLSKRTGPKLAEEAGVCHAIRARAGKVNHCGELEKLREDQN